MDKVYASLAYFYIKLYASNCNFLALLMRFKPFTSNLTRSISLNVGEMLVGSAVAFFMDEISTGLDSSTTYQIVKFMRQMVHVMDVTMIISLLQPAPETYDLFDDIILLSDGQIVYQGPRENVLEFFEHVGFKCPER